LDVERFGEGAFISQAVAFGDVVWLAGAVTRGDAARQTIAEQARDIFEQIDLNLAAAGSSRDQLLFVNVWLSRIGDWTEFNTAWMVWLDGQAKPARATVECRLTPPFGIEIAASAARRRATAQAEVAA
jgi:enamine deaminase RidA (YjgF/YER057c/UK114 family)